MLVYTENDSFGSLGFTSELKAALRGANLRLDVWCREQMAKADEREQNARNELLMCQDEVNKNCSDILEMRRNTGKYCDSSDSVNTLAVYTTSLMDQVRVLDEEKSTVVNDIDIKKKKIEGTTEIVHSFLKVVFALDSVRISRYF